MTITLTKERLVEVLTYLPKTGEFIRNSTGEPTGDKTVTIDTVKWKVGQLASFWVSPKSELKKRCRVPKEGRCFNYHWTRALVRQELRDKGMLSKTERFLE